MRHLILVSFLTALVSCGSHDVPAPTVGETDLRVVPTDSREDSCKGGGGYGTDWGVDGGGGWGGSDFGGSGGAYTCSRPSGDGGACR